ncbi:hypothetical protein [Spirosoma jeollabukense]
MSAQFEIDSAEPKQLLTRHCAVGRDKDQQASAASVGWPHSLPYRPGQAMTMHDMTNLCDWLF